MPKEATTSTPTGQTIWSMRANIKLVRFRCLESPRDLSTRSKHNTMRKQKVLPLGIEYLYSKLEGGLLRCHCVLYELLGRESLRESFQLFPPFWWKHNFSKPDLQGLRLLLEQTTLPVFLFFILVCFDRCQGGLISWIRGFQYTPCSESTGRNHQIIQEDHPLVTAWITRITSRSSCLATGEVSLLRLRGSSFWWNLNESTLKLRRSSKWEFDSSDPRPSGSKGCQEAFRRGALARAETPKRKERKWRKWNAQRSYHEHPYWTDNLKYVC